MFLCATPRVVGSAQCLLSHVSYEDYVLVMGPPSPARSVYVNIWLAVLPCPASVVLPHCVRGRTNFVASSLSCTGHHAGDKPCGAP